MSTHVNRFNDLISDENFRILNTACRLVISVCGNW